MLKSVPMGQSVDVVLRRGYPMLYNPDGCPKQSLEPVGTLRSSYNPSYANLPPCALCCGKKPVELVDSRRRPTAPPA